MSAPVAVLVSRLHAGALQCGMSALVVSTFADATYTTPQDLDVAVVLRAIRTGRMGEKNLREQIEQIRNRFQAEFAITGDYKKAKLAVDPLKKQLPAVTWSGRFLQRANDKLNQYSGLLCADSDGLNGVLPEVRDKLRTSPHLFALFVSPSGDGLKAVFRVPADASKHAGSFRAVQSHVRELCGVEIDESGKDLARLCFFSHDPDVYHNPDAQEIAPSPVAEKPQRGSNGVVNLSERQRIAVELVGEIRWNSEAHGFATCPGKDLHTTGDSERDCEIYLDGSPTLHCFHNHCTGIIAGTNHELRSRIGKAEHQNPYPSRNAEAAREFQAEIKNADAAQAHGGSSADDETLSRLAAMSPLEYERKREAEAERLGCRASVLDSLVKAKRPSKPGNDTLQGQAVTLSNIEPWPEAVNGAEVLDWIVERFNRYVVLPLGAADVLALFCAHTHCYKVFQCSPRLNISSPEKQCGKTTLRDVVALFVPRPLLTENLTSAVLFRLVEAQSPVILADEYDSWITGNEELRGLLNSGHRKGAMVYRCESDSNEVRGFAAYAPAVLCGIGALPGTLHDRSIVIRLERAKRRELQARFDSRHVELEQELCRKLARWCNDNLARIEGSDPKLPEGAFNRVADNWRPLFAIAEIAGGDWPRRCADAFTRLTSRESEDAESLRVTLLADIQEVFTTERIFSKDLIEQLAEMKERPWPEVCHGKAISERWLARNLAAFGIRSKTLRIGEERAKGYELADFAETFERYLKPDEGDFIRDSVTYDGEPPFSFRDKIENVTDEKKLRIEGMSPCHACETPKPANGTSEALI